jgi:STE24 endopeptidase
MISALKKLSADNLGNLLPHPFYVFLHYSHPPVTARVAALRGLSSGG